MDKRKNSFVPAVGGCSLLVIFAVLCLTIFSLLSLAGVQADRRLAQAGAQAASGFYAAEFKANETLAQLRAGERPEGVRFRGDRCTFCVSAGTSQILAVEVRVRGKEFQILRWQAISTSQWAPEDGINLWDGGSSNSTAPLSHEERRSVNGRI